MEGKSTEARNLDRPRLEMSSKRRWAVTIGVMTAMFIAALEATIVGTAMPTVIATLGGLNRYSWVFTAYIVTSTVTVPVWGKLSDLYGRRLPYQIGIGIFLLGTLLSGMSMTMTQLIIFRAVQGLGAGALVPLAVTIIGDIFTLKERARMQALFSGVWGLSSVIGPIIGGFITDHISWRWVFFINLPIGVVAAIVLGFALKEPKLEEKPKIDYAGTIVLTVAISLLMLAMAEGGITMATLFAPLNLLLFGASAVLLLLFILIEKRAADPIIPFALFRNPTISVSIISGFLAGFAMFGGISFIPLFAQGALGATATQAGSLLTPLMLSWVTMSVIGGRVLLKIGYRTISLIGFVILTIGFALLTQFERTTGYFWLYFDLVLIGSGLGLTMLTLLIAVQQAVDRTKLGIATSLNQFTRSIGGAFGVAIMGAVLTAGLATELHKVAQSGTTSLTDDQATAYAANPNALIDPQAKAGIPAEMLAILQGAMAASIHPAFLVAAIVSGLALIVCFFLPKDKRDEIHKTDGNAGERMIMSEQTTIDAGHQPVAELEDDEEDSA